MTNSAKKINKIYDDPKKLNPKSQVPKKKSRWEIRGLDIIYDDTKETTLEEILKHLKNLKNGIHAGFIIKHTEDDKNHIHCGIHLRDKPKSLYYSDLSKHFQYNKLKCRVQKLKNPSRSYSAKLQTYYDYCVDQDKHIGQIISEPLLHKWKPKTLEEKSKPKEYIYQKIREGLILSELNDIMLDTSISLKLFSYITENYDKISRVIEVYQDALEARKLAKQYQEEVKKYRPFQTSLTKILDDQNDRNIHIHHDTGLTGKNYWLYTESMRPDTLILQSAQTKRIAAAWNPKKHSRIIFDIPKGKMEFLNTSVIEKLKNGVLFSTMHHPKMKKSSFKPSIVVVGNEPLPPGKWTDDRETESTTNNSDYQLKILKDGTYGGENSLPTPPPQPSRTRREQSKDSDQILSRSISPVSPKLHDFYESQTVSDID